MSEGIIVRILGDFGPFSRMGKSVGYEVEIGGAIYLIDCGAPLFQQIGGEGLKHIQGLIVTHCHDDHKRWFSDLALFNRYASDGRHKIPLITSESVHSEIIEASMPALDKSLSSDSKRVVDIPYEDYVDSQVIGPVAKYRIVSLDEGNGRTGLCVMDRNGNTPGPERAKIIINPATKRPRLLFKDPVYHEWIEPESFYPFSSAEFFEADTNIYRGEGFSIEALKSPVWHGVTGIGLKIRTSGETLIFSSDTAHDTELWKQLHREKRAQRLGMPAKDFAAAAVIYGDINDYIERTWSEHRYLEAIKAFEGAVVIHDISIRNSIVHTDYEKLSATTLKKDLSILTHGPDRITSEWVLSNAGKSFLIRGNQFFEIVENRLYPMNAHLFHKEAGRYYTGYRNENGRYAVHEENGLLRLERRTVRDDGSCAYAVDLYEDIGGKYFPKKESENAFYLKRNDGKVELIELNEDGSQGKVVENERDRLNPPFTGP